MGKVEMGGGGVAATGQGHAGRRSRSLSDLGGGGRPRSRSRQSQLYLEPTLLPRLSRSLGKHLYWPRRRASVGGDAVRRRVYRRRFVRPVPDFAHGRARRRLWVAAVLGAAAGRAGGLCRRHRRSEAEAERIYAKPSVFL